MKNDKVQSCEISSEFVSLQIDSQGLCALNAAAEASFEVAAAIIQVSDDTET